MPGKTVHVTRSHCSDDCSDIISHHRLSEDPRAEMTAARSTRPDDVEKAAGLEKAVFTVQGMTCSGCGNKLKRTLSSIPGVSNIRVTFVMGTADFDLDNSMMRVEDVLLKAEKATGFKCARVKSDNQHFDLLMTSTAAKWYSSNLPLGVQLIERLDKRTVRVTYDPTVVGARSLLTEFGLQEDGVAPPRPDSSLTSGKKRLYEMLISTSLAVVFTIPVVVLAWGNSRVSEYSRAYVSIVLATLVQGLAVPEFYIPAISSLIYSHAVEMDLLVVISITAAYIYSVAAFGCTMVDRPLETKEFFETSTLLITLVLFGRLIAAYARIRAVQAVSLRSLQTTTTILVEGDSSRKIDARLMQFGDVFIVPAHAQVPTDGQVAEGSSELDESMLTGESLPVAKATGDEIIAGTINGAGTLVIRLTRLPGKNTVTDIAGLVIEASSAKPRVQDLADKVAGWFVPVVALIAVIVILVWAVIGVKIRDYSTGRTVSNAITYAIAVLAVSCPCALGLAVPMVLVVAGGVAARGGVIIKSADSTEKAHRVNNVVFDKTGTLTTSEPDVIAEAYFSHDPTEATSLADSLVRDSNHPVSMAVAKYLSAKEFPVNHFEDIQIIPGAGVEASRNGSLYRAGNAHWLSVAEVPEVEQLLQQGATTLCVTKDSQLIAVFGLKSTLRPEAASVVRELLRRNIEVHLVSGDEQTAVEVVAVAVGIESKNVAARKTPAEKRIYVQELMSQNKTVLFCGDGTNDAVAVAQANVGVQMGTSSDVTRAIADVVLLSGLEGVLFLLDVSKAAFYRIVFNFVWSAIYNVLAISLAAGAFVRVRIPPAYAGLGEIVSVLPVIAVATTLSGMKRKPLA
jgi:Cd2+-exporting ATPase